MSLDLNRLKVFYHVYSLQSINLAANAIHLTQPGVTHHIKKLEDEIKTLLFVRQHRKIIPTTAADRLFSLVKPFIEKLDEEISKISKPMNRPYGLLRIGAPFEFGKTYLPNICHAFRVKFNDVIFKIRLEEPDQLLDMLSKGVLDFAVIDYFSTKDQFFGKSDLYKITPLTEEIFVLVGSKDYIRKKVQGSLSFDELISMDFVTDENEPFILKHWFWYYFKKSVSRFNIVMAIESHQALLDCVRLGMGLAITADHLVIEEIKAGKLKPIFPSKDKVINQVSLVELRDKDPTLTEREFRLFLERQIQSKKVLKSGTNYHKHEFV
jgi:DNA-binding transcriptional LysR family regulator